MGRSIVVIENSAHIPAERRVDIANVLTRHAKHFWLGRYNSTERNIDLLFWDNDPRYTLLCLNSPDVDFITDSPVICKAMAAVGTTGRIIFGSFNGTKNWSIWGVEFCLGSYHKLSGEIYLDLGSPMRGYL